MSLFRSALDLLPLVLIGSGVVAYSLIRRRSKASWGDLPPELCSEIGMRISSRLDIVRFRSVCMKWRLSLPPPTLFPLWVPPLPNCESNEVLGFFIKEVSIAKSGSSYLALEEVGQGGKFCACFICPEILKFDMKSLAKHPLSAMSLVSKAYHLRVGVPYPHLSDHLPNRVENWVFEANMYSEIICSGGSGVNPSYARASDLTVVAHLSGENMKGRLALLRLEGGEWDTEFCDQVFEDISSYNGKLCALDAMGRVLVMDYRSLEMTQMAPPSPIPREMERKEMFEASGELYLADTRADVLYRLSLRGHKCWVRAHNMRQVKPFLTPYKLDVPLKYVADYFRWNKLRD